MLVLGTDQFLIFHIKDRRAPNGLGLTRPSPAQPSPAQPNPWADFFWKQNHGLGRAGPGRTLIKIQKFRKPRE